MGHSGDIRLAIVLILLVGCGWSPPRRTAAPVQVVAVVLDRSDSGVLAERCLELSSRLDGLLKQPEVQRLDLLVLATGDNTTGSEPVAIVAWEQFRPTEHLYGDPKEERIEREKWADGIAARCRSALVTATTSPIYLGVLRAAESVRAHCAEIEALGGRCDPRPILAIHSDGRETVDPWLASQTSKSRRRRAASSTKPVVELGGMDVRFCGFASFHGPAASGIDVIGAWRAVLGDGAALDPVCRSANTNKEAPMGGGTEIQ